MAFTQIVFPSAGSLSVAVVAAFILVLQAWFSTKGAEFRWCRWAAAVSLATILYAVGIFLEYNAPEGPVNRFGGLLEWTAVIFLLHALYGLIFSRLNIPSRRYHLAAGVLHALILILLWSTHIFVSDRFVTRHFFGLEKPFVEADLGPLGPVFMLYALFASIHAVRIWITKEKEREVRSSAYVWGASFWILLGAHDAAAAMGLPSVQYVMEYGFLGFSATLLYGMFSDYARTSNGLGQANVDLRREMETRERAEEALRKRDLRFRLLTDTIEDVFWMSTWGVGKMIYISPGYERLWERSVESLYQSPRSLLEAIHPDDLNRLLGVMETYHKNGKPYECEYRIVRSDGGIRWIHERGYSVADLWEGDPLMAGVCTDITTRKEAEEKAKSYLRFLELLNDTAISLVSHVERETIYDFIGLKMMDLLEDCIVVIHAYEEDTDCLCVTAVVGLGKREDQLQVFLGGSPVGMRFKITDEKGRSELMTGRLVDGPPGIHALSFGAIPEEACKEIENLIGLQKTYGCGFVYNGGLLGSAVILSSRDYPFKDRGTLEAFISQASIALQRMAAAEALRESEQRFRSIFENSMDAIFLSASDGRVFFANRAACEMTGYTEKEFMELGRNALFDPADPELQDALEEHRSKGRFRGGLSLKRKDGSRFSAELSSNVFKDIRGSETTVILIRDITVRKRFEEALQLAEKRYRILSELTSDFAGSYTVEPDGNIVSEWVWGAVKDITGFTAEEIDARGGWKSLVHPDDVPIALNHMEALFSGRPDTCELRIITANGEVRWLQNQARPERDSASGRVVRIYGASTDITGRKQAEAALRESEEKYRALFELESDAILLVDDESLQVLDANSSALRLYGYERDEILSKKITDLSAEPEKTLKAIRERIPLVALRWHVKKDGTTFPVEITRSVFEWRGRDVHLAAVRDISKRMEAEKELKETRDLLMSVLDNAPALIYVNATDHRYRLVNKAWEGFAEKTAEQVTGRTPREIFLPRTAREFEETTQKVMKSGSIVTYEESVVRHGKEFHFHTTKFPLISAGGEIEGVGGISVDISERKRAQEELRQSREQLFHAQKMETLGTLVAGVAHEINNPVSLILFNAPLLRRIWSDLQSVLDDRAGVEPNRKYGGITHDYLKKDLDRLLEDMELAGNRIASVVKGLKDFTRRSEVAQKKTMSFNEAVENALRLAQTTVKKLGVQMKVALGTDLPPMLGNMQSIEQIVLNIVINGVQAIKHEQGMIEVRTAYDEPRGGLTLNISDNGEGIDPSVSGRIFDPFYTSRQGEGGTGLGLAVTHSLVRDHKGQITFESEVGKGTTFKVFFPLRPEEVRFKLLVVDDDAPVRKVLGKAFGKGSRFEVRTAKGGTEALLKMGTYRPDVLIADLMMPGMDGLELCRTLRELPELSDVAVVIITGYVNDRRLEGIRKLGYTRIYPKPLDIKEFVKEVEGIVEEKKPVVSRQ